MADAHPDGLPPQSAEHLARFLVVSAREDRGLIRRSRPVAPDDFLNRVRDLPAMLFPNAPRPNAPRPNAPRMTPLPHLADLSGTPIIDSTPRVQAATERLELAIEAADRSEQSLLAMQSALARAQRRNLVFGVASCMVVAISLGFGTLGRFHFGATASVPPAEAAVTTTAATTRVAATSTPPATTATPAAANPLPVPPLPASSEVATNNTAAAQAATEPTVLAEETAPAATQSPSDNPTAADGSETPVSDQSAQPSLIEAASGNAPTLLRSLPPGSIIVSPLPEPPPPPPEMTQPPVQEVSVTGAATVAASHVKRHYVYRRPVRYYYYRPPQLLGQVVNTLGRDIRSLFH